MQRKTDHVHPACADPYNISPTTQGQRIPQRGGGNIVRTRGQVTDYVTGNSNSMLPKQNRTVAHQLICQSARSKSQKVILISEEIQQFKIAERGRSLLLRE